MTGLVDLDARGKGRSRAERLHELRPEKAQDPSDGRGFNSPHLHEETGDATVDETGRQASDQGFSSHFIGTCVTGWSQAVVALSEYERTPGLLTRGFLVPGF